MKTKQLANVLIKILGLSVLVHAIPSFLTALLPMLQAIGFPERTAWNYYWLYLLADVVSVAIGIYLIAKSRNVAAFLFKDEND
jgi:zinc transporter ZupT